MEFEEFISTQKNPNVCIKVQIKGISRNQNKLERFYLAVLRLKNIDYKNVLPNFYGTVDTNLGAGMMYELIRDYDGNISRSLSHYLRYNIITLKQAEIFIIQLQQSLLANSILLEDKNIENILKKDERSNFTPILIDGFGGKRLEIKFIFASFISLYSKFKTRKRVKQMITKMNDNFSTL